MGLLSTTDIKLQLRYDKKHHSPLDLLVHKLLCLFQREFGPDVQTDLHYKAGGVGDASLAVEIATEINL